MVDVKAKRQVTTVSGVLVHAAYKYRAMSVAQDLPLISANTFSSQQCCTRVAFKHSTAVHQQQQYITAQYKPPTWKHSQYFFMQWLFLQLQPRRCWPPTVASASICKGEAAQAQQASISSSIRRENNSRIAPCFCCSGLMLLCTQLYMQADCQIRAEHSAQSHIHIHSSGSPSAQTRLGCAA